MAQAVSSPIAFEIEPYDPLDPFSEEALPALTPSMQVDPNKVIDDAINNPLTKLACLQGLDLDEVFHPNTSQIFTSLLSGSMRIYAKRRSATLRNTAFLYALFEQDIVDVDDQSRAIYLAGHLRCGDLQFAKFLVQSIKWEREEEIRELQLRVIGRQRAARLNRSECERAIDMFGLPPGLARFARALSLVPFAIGYLRALFGTPDIRNDEWDLAHDLSKKYNICYSFATFLYTQFLEEIPAHW